MFFFKSRFVSTWLDVIKKGIVVQPENFHVIVKSIEYQKGFLPMLIAPALNIVFKISRHYEPSVSQLHEAEFLKTVRHSIHLGEGKSFCDHGFCFNLWMNLTVEQNLIELAQFIREMGREEQEHWRVHHDINFTK